MRTIIDNYFSISLSTAGVIIGYLGIAGAVVKSIICVLALIVLKTDFDKIEEIRLQHGESQYLEDLSRESAVTTNVLIAGLIIYILCIIPSVLLVIGVKTGSDKLLLPWLIICASGLGLIPIRVIISLGKSSVPMIEFIGSFVIGVWSWIVIYILYQEIQRKRLTQSTLTQP